jgi:hypothetical protein
MTVLRKHDVVVDNALSVDGQVTRVGGLEKIRTQCR